MQDESYPVAKACNGCQVVKPLDAFHRDAHKSDGHAGICRECKNQRSAQWRDAHPGYFDQYRRAHLEQFAAYSRQRHAQRPEYYRAYRAEHREQYSAYRQTPQERARQAQWIRDNPEKVRAMFRIINSRRRAAEGSFTDEEWTALCAKYGNRCLRCERTDRTLTVDHVIPVSKGGANWIANLQPLCGPCNSWKNGRYIDYRPPE